MLSCGAALRRRVPELIPPSASFPQNERFDDDDGYDDDFDDGGGDDAIY